MEKLERLKNILGHKSSAQTYAGLFEEIADLALKKLDPMEKPAEALPQDAKSSTIGTRYIPAKMKRAVWQRDQKPYPATVEISPRFGHSSELRSFQFNSMD